MVTLGNHAIPRGIVTNVSNERRAPEGGWFHLATHQPVAAVCWGKMLLLLALYRAVGCAYAAQLAQLR
jgi:hypothetical protein